MSLRHYRSMHILWVLDLFGLRDTDYLTTICYVKHEHILLVEHEANRVNASLTYIICFTRSAPFGQTESILAEYINPVFEGYTSIVVGNLGLLSRAL